MMTKIESEYKPFDTIFYQGANSSQTQVLHYTGSQVLQASTGESMWCEGRNNLKPLNVIYNLHIGPEIADVNLNPYASYYDYINPVKWLYTAGSWSKHYYTGTHIEASPNPTLESVAYHTPHFPQMSYGQTSDIESHHNKYLHWKENKTNDGLILYGVSRGTATTFCALATYQYPEAKLVILEGAIDSMENVMKNMITQYVGDNAIADQSLNSLRSAVSYLSSKGLFGYKEDGPSPLSLLEQFPEQIPVVFITSTIDTTVSPQNTKHIAQALNNRGKNDVYVLELKNSRHPFYAYDDKQDHDDYESLIHAVYKKYGQAHDTELANTGEHLLESCLLVKSNSNALAL